MYDNKGSGKLLKKRWVLNLAERHFADDSTLPAYIWMKEETRRKEKSPLNSNTKVTKNEHQLTENPDELGKFTIWEEKLFKKASNGHNWGHLSTKFSFNSQIEHFYEKSYDFSWRKMNY